MNQMVFELCSGTIRLEVERDLTLFSMGGGKPLFSMGGEGGANPSLLPVFSLKLFRHSDVKFQDHT